ncbi:MAG TPA: hypothetical protein VGX28_11760 [Frankiaceae bacterium]|jgi:hypothetical protein|nr:hypothetical protein [Frankiaceae bacterium]
MLRARFVAVPLALLGTFVGYLATVTVADAMEERGSRQREREYERAYAPAREALAGVRLDGMTPCASRHPAETACLTGTVEVKATSAEVEAALRDLGATGVTSRCRDLKDRSVCFAEAMLHGNDVHVMVANRLVAGKPTKTVTATFSASPHVDIA